MSPPTVTYIAQPDPVRLSDDGLTLFGGYLVEYDDGFHVYSPHAARPWTVSADPVDLDLNPEFRDLLIQHADAIHSETRG